MKLEAFRAQRWRYLRLLDLFEEVEQVADALDSRAWLGNPLLELSDRKGDFTAIWTSEVSARQFHAIVDEIWFRLDLDADGTVHEWEDDAGTRHSFFIERPSSTQTPLN